MTSVYIFMLSFVVLLSFESCAQQLKTVQQLEEQHPEYKNYKKAYFASGCFWCVEAIYESVDGVFEAVSGYAGGEDTSPTYKRVGSGSSDHAESVLVYYDDKKVDYETLVRVYFNSKDNASITCQGPDCGAAYRSMLLYSNDDEKKIAEDLLAKMISAGDIPKHNNNSIEKIHEFYIAEDYHQNFEKLHPNQGYIKAVSIPRIKKFQRKMPKILKKKH